MAASASETSSTWVTETASGSHRFTVTGYSLTKGIGVGKPISSASSPWAPRLGRLQPNPPRPRRQALDVDPDRSAAQVLQARRGEGVQPLHRKKRLESNFLKDDCLVVHCTVTVLKESRLQVPNSCSTKPRPSDLHLHLERLLESGEGTDVTFRVGGEAFSAHRWLLARGSPVFKAELFGEMKEKNCSP
uniref:BTB domain-containing protein n=1 Tax=Ananas comosus var. bracteatus TaxID=296719 RepID=A0A6V7P5U8_ANACO|nr:unnamed protein product [Ananas comosus var. bracteatus]